MITDFPTGQPADSSEQHFIVYSNSLQQNRFNCFFFPAGLNMQQVNTAGNVLRIPLDSMLPCYKMAVNQFSTNRPVTS